MKKEHQTLPKPPTKWIRYDLTDVSLGQLLDELQSRGFKVSAEWVGVRKS